MQNSSIHAKKNCVQEISAEIELEICNFYTKIIDDMCKLHSINYQDIRASLLTIKKATYKNTESGKRHSVSFDHESDRLAYVFTYSFIHSTVMYGHFFNLLKFNSTMKEKISSMKELRLCILGGGPGFEAISLCKIIGDLRKQRDENCRPLLLKVTVIDVCEAWKNDAEYIIAAAQREICSTNIKIDFQFMKTDLTSKISGGVKKALKNAHIITMFKFLSDIDETLHPSSEINQMIQVSSYFILFHCLRFLNEYLVNENLFYQS